MKISRLVATLQAIQQEPGDLTYAEDLPLGFFAVRYVDTKEVPVQEGETVVLIRGQ